MYGLEAICPIDQTLYIAECISTAAMSPRCVAFCLWDVARDQESSEACIL